MAQDLLGDNTVIKKNDILGMHNSAKDWMYKNVFELPV